MADIKILGVPVVFFIADRVANMILQDIYDMVKATILNKLKQVWGILRDKHLKQLVLLSAVLL